MLMKHLLAITVATSVLALPATSFAISAGDACTSAGDSARSGDASHGSLLICNGSNYVSIMDYDTAGNLIVGGVVSATTLVGDGSGLTGVGGAFVVSGTTVVNNADFSHDFLFGSTQLGDTGDAAHDYRMFFDKSKAAFRAGGVDANQWDDANVGTFSFAATYNSTASGDGSVAIGLNSTASGMLSNAIGNSVQASGHNATAIGGYGNVASGIESLALGTNNVTASANYSIALGRQVNTTGAYSMAIGVGTAPGVSASYPTVSGSNSFGIFMGDRTGDNITANNTMAIMGGNVGIGTTAPANKLDVIGTVEINDATNSGDWQLQVVNAHNSFNQSVIRSEYTGTNTPSNVKLFSGYAAGSSSEVFSVNASGSGAFDGSVIIGNGGETCSGTTEGALRYTTSGGLELCNGTTWGSSAATPAILNVADYINFPTATGTGLATERWIGADGANSTFYNVPAGSSHIFGVSNTTVMNVLADGIDITGNLSVGTASSPQDLTVLADFRKALGVYRDHDASVSFTEQTIELGARDGATLTPSVSLHGISNYTGAQNVGEFAIRTLQNGAMTYAFFIDETGNVGLNTTSPSTFLDGVTGMSIDGGASPGGIAVGNNTQNYLMYASGTNFFLYDGVNNVNRVTMDNAGRFGIGTSLSSISNRFVVQDSLSPTVARLHHTANDNVFLQLSGSSNSAFVGSKGGNFVIQTPGSSFSDKVTVDVAGNVGIGTTTPSTKLTLSSNGDTSASGTPMLRLENLGTGANHNANIILSTNSGNAALFKQSSTTTGYGGAGSLNIGQAGNEPLAFITNNNVRMFINGAGNVGVGTTAPAQKFHVHEASVNPSYIQISNADTGADSSSGFQLVSSSNAADLIQRENAPMRFSTNDSEKMRITAAGNVGIGTSTPSEKLTIDSGASAGYIFIKNSTAPSGARIGYQGSTIRINNYQQNGKIEFSTTPSAGSDTIRMTLDSDGELGIGATNPAYRLHVNGTAYATGAAGALSDRRHKDNITDLAVNGTATINQLRPVSFSWKQPEDAGMEGTQFGFIAQELEQVLPAAVMTQEDASATKAIKMDALIPVLVKALQEQQAHIEILQQRLDVLEAAQQQ